MVLRNCDICGKRQAVYYRKSSGHKLCPICFKRVIQKSVKRFIARNNMLKPFDKILVMYSIIVPYYAFLVYVILSVIEKNYRAEIAIAVPHTIKDYAESFLARYENPRIITFPASLLEKPLARAQDYVRLERRIGVDKALSLGYNVVALPYTRLELSSFFMAGFLENNFENAFVTEEYIDADGKIRIITPLANIGPDDATFYAYLLGLLNERLSITSYLKDDLYTRAKKMLLLLYNENTETLYATRTSILTALSMANSIGLKRCKKCYTWSYSDVCHVCRTLDLDR